MKVEMDLKTVEWIVDHIKAEDYSVFPLSIEECDKCGAMYIESLGHDCNRAIEVTAYEVDDTQTEPKEKCPFDDPIPCEWVNCPNSTDCAWK